MARFITKRDVLNVGHYGTVPIAGICHAEALNFVDKAVAMYLFGRLYAESDSEIFCSQSTIARHLGVSRKTVNHAIRRMRKAGYVWVEPRGNGRTLNMRFTQKLKLAVPLDAKGDQDE